MRSNFQIKTKWDLSLLFPSFSREVLEEYLESRKKEAESFRKRWLSDKSWKKDPRVLSKALQDYEKLNREGVGSNRATLFVSLAASLKQGDSKILGLSNIVEKKAKEINDQVRFFLLELSKISPKYQKLFLSHPSLKKWRHLLEIVFRQGKHLLSEKEEFVISRFNSLAYTNWVRATSRFLSEEEIKVSWASLPQPFHQVLNVANTERDEKKRMEAVKKINKIFERWAKVAETELNAVLRYKEIQDNLRSYPRPDSSTHLEDDIDTRTVDTVREVVRENYSLSHRFYEIKSFLFKKKRIDYSWRQITFFSWDRKVSFKRAVSLVGEVLQEWDKEFYDLFVEMLEQGRIDVYPRRGKRGGGFMSSPVYNAPSFILLNWGNSFDDVRTLIHEMGHAVHSELSKKYQDALNWDYPISLGEVASTFFEGLLFLHSVERAKTKREKRVLYESYLQEAVSTVFRQIACYELEWRLHQTFREKGYLAEKEINQLFLEEMSSYLGPRVSLKGFERWWIYWSHIRYYFYVYSYAFGFLASQAFINLLREDKSFIKKVKEFLSLGGSLSTEEAFFRVGLNVREKGFWERGIKEVANYLSELERLL